jgi:hypothetical protein
MDQMQINLEKLSNVSEPLITPTGRLKLKDKQSGLSRKEVIQTFQLAFEMIGGIPRLATWADTNPGDFYKLFGRLLPNSSSVELDGDTIVTIQHALPPPTRNDPDAE